jgi:hypothetical protein
MFPGGVVVTILSTYVFYLLAGLPSGRVLEVKNCDLAIQMFRSALELSDWEQDTGKRSDTR